MTFRQYLDVARARWAVLVAGLLLGGAVAGLYVGLSQRTYTAHAQLFVSTAAQQSLTDLNAGGSFVQDQVKSYAAVVTTPSLTRPVIAQLGLPYTPAQLAREISASAPMDTVLINVAVADADPVRAARIVNALASGLTGYIGQLETPVGATAAPVKATVTQFAQPPSSPSSPNLVLDLALGLVVGLVVGAGGAVALETLDNRVGGRRDVAELAGAPVVGLIGEDPQVPTTPLILQADAFSSRAEAFRQLRTNVRFLRVDAPVRSLVVTGSVEDEGKSLTAANLAIALAQSGERVALVDADLRRPSVAGMFGLPAGVGLTTVLVGSVGLEAALQTWRDDLTLDVLVAGPTPPNPSELLGSQRLVEVLRRLLDTHDVVVFDSPPLLPVTDATLLARATDGALVVTRARATREAQLAAAVAAVRSADATVLGVVVNRIPRRRRGALAGHGTYGSYERDARDEGYRPLSAPDPTLAAPHLRPAAAPAAQPGAPATRSGGARPRQLDRPAATAVEPKG